MKKACRARSAVTLSVAFCLFALWLVGFSEATLAQRRNRGRRSISGPSAKSPVDYSRFSHATNKHQAACNTCHKIPTRNWQQVSAFPDIADYPDHDACVSCHRQQFFKGTRPVICTICHVKVSPRDEARFTFRNPAAQRQFTIEFPHDKHQDVIARLESPVNSKLQFGFVRASFKAARFDDKSKTYNNCTICHESRKEDPLPPLGGWIDSFAPDAATFKSVPSNHASCFNCHWKSQQPVNHDCAGCHKPAKPHAVVASVQRLSMKFRHAREQHLLECTACHINITKASTLRGLTPDVPITSCTECHNKIGLREDLDAELVKLEKDKNFVCTYCHTSDKGKLGPPASHYLIAGRNPIKRTEMR